MAELLLADPWDGASHVALAFFGNFVARPEGLGLLPTFSLIVAMNGFIAGLKALVVLHKKHSALVISGSLISNYLKLALIAHPILYSLGFMYSWRLLNGLRDTFIPAGPPGPAEDSDSADPPGQPFLPFTGQGRVAGSAPDVLAIGN